MKKIIFSILLINAGLAYAGSMGASCDIDDLEKPCGTMQTNIEAGGLYFRSEYKTVPFSTERTENPSTGSDQRNYTIKTSYEWGFFIDGSIFLENDRDLTGNFYYFNSTKRGNHSLGGDGNVTGDLAPNWVATNIELGQTMNVTSKTDLRLFASLTYAWLRIRTSYDAFIAPARDYPFGQVDRLAFGDSEVKFNGIGPRIGLNIYDPGAKASWMNGIRLYAKGAVSLLIGTTESRVFYSNLGAFAESSTIAIPAVDAKVGVDYTPALFNQYVTIDLGWQGFNYFHAVESTSRDRKGVFFQGVYAGAKWNGNMM